MSHQQLQDDVENIVLSLKKILPVLKNLGDSTQDKIDEKLEGSLSDINHRIDELSCIIVQLQSAANSNTTFISTAKDDAIDHLQKGIAELIETDIKVEYKDQIEKIVEAIKPVVIAKLDCEIAKLIDQKTLSIKDYNTQITDINRDFKTKMATTHDLIFKNVTKLNQANTDASTRFDDNLDKLHQITQDHQEALAIVQNDTALTAQDMQKTLTSIKRMSLFVAQSPTVMTAMVVAFLAMSVMLAIVYRLKLWWPVMGSALLLGVILAMIWGLMIWLDTRAE